MDIGGCTLELGIQQSWSIDQKVSNTILLSVQLELTLMEVAEPIMRSKVPICPDSTIVSSPG